MTKYKDVENKIDEAVKLSQKNSKEYGFNICMNDGEITTTNIEERDKNFISNEKECQGTKGSFHVHPGKKDANPSPKDTSDIQPGVQKL